MAPSEPELPPFPGRLLTGLVLASIVGVVLLTGSALWSKHLLEQSEAEYARVETLRGEILLLDETLTMSTRLAVAGRLLARLDEGDASAPDAWEVRYREAEAELDRALAELDALLKVSPARQQLARMTAEANEALIAMEHRALAADTVADLRAARAALAGPEYGRWKGVYTRGMSAMIADTRVHFGEQIALQKKVFGAVLPVAVALVLLMVFMWATTRRGLTRWAGALASAAGQLASARDEAQRARDEAQQARDVAQRARLSLEDAVDAARLGVFELRADDSLTASGQATASIAGASTLAGLLAVVAPEERSAVELELRRGLSADSPTVGSSAVRTVNRRWLAISWRRVAGAEGARLLGLLQDVTDERQRAARLADEVEQKSALAEARRLDNAELLQVMLQAEHDNQLKLARLVHDELQQLIVSGLQFARMARDAVGRGDDPGELLAACIDALDRAYEAARSVHSALRAPAFEALPLREILDEVAVRAPLEVEVRVEGDLAGVEPDLTPAARWVIGLVAQESVLNAVKYAGVGRARVELVVDPASLTLTVGDEGRGFDASAASAGTGLADARQRARWLGGSLAVHSAPGEGTRVVLRVPRADRRRPATSGPMGVLPSAAAMRVLIVDDERTVRHATASRLRQEGCFDVVAHARDGDEAVAAAVSLRPDAVVMDYGLPGRNGDVVIGELLAVYPSVRVVGYTARADEARGSMLEAGAVAVVDKAADGQVLVDALLG